MKALRFHGNKDIRLDEIPEPQVRPGWVKIKNGWAGVCGSDLVEYLVGPYASSKLIAAICTDLEQEECAN